MLLRLVKVLLLLLFGTIIGWLLGFAYASHLFGSDIVGQQIAHIIGGDSVMDVPATPGLSAPGITPPGFPSAAPIEVELPADDIQHFRFGTAVLIPKLGACIGFGVAAAVLLGSISYRIFQTLVSQAKGSHQAELGADGQLRYTVRSDAQSDD